jgi:hypothetical protein
VAKERVVVMVARMHVVAKERVVVIMVERAGAYNTDIR